MDVKYTPPTTTAERPKLTAEPIAPTGPQRTPLPRTAELERQVDTRATSTLLESGRSEGRGLHERLIAELREQIRSGTYTADLDVVADRIADVLGIP